MAYQPFYIMNAQNQEENWEELEEKDWNYIKDMYPQMAKSIQEKVDEECDKLEYDGSMMFDEYPDKLMIRNICERIYKDMQEENVRNQLYEEEEGQESGAEVYPMNQNSSANMPIEDELMTNMPIERSIIEESADSVQNSQVCNSCQKRQLQGTGWGFRPPQGGPGFPPPRPPQGGPGFPPPRPPQGGPGFPPPRPPQGGPGFPPPRPPHGGPGWISPRPPRPCSCPPGRPCRDCLIALQNQPDWMRDMIEVLLYQEMMHRRSRRRRRRQYQRNY